MKKQNKSNRQMTLFAVIATVIFMFAASANVAAQGKFNVGDRVECDWTQRGKWEKGTVVPYDKSDNPSVANYYRVRLDSDPNDERGMTCIIKYMRPLTTAAPNEDLREQPGKEDGQKTTADKEKPNETIAGRFKAGDRVTACKIQLDNFPACWENGTIVKDMMAEKGGDNYQVLIDDPQGGKGGLFYVPSRYIRGGAPPAPATPDCPFNEPPGTVAKTSKPSAELFKRVIFESYRDTSNGRKVGITYQTFALGKSYVNRLTNNGLLHTGAPQGATIYSVKTKYLFCDQYTDSTIRWLVESQFACFKDKFGDWVCPVGGVPKYLEQIYLPNK